MKEIVVYGTGGMGREVAWLVQSCNDQGEKYRVVCFADDSPKLHGMQLNGIPVVSLQAARQQHPDASMVVGVGSPRTREMMVGKAAALGFEFETIIHPRVDRSGQLEIGQGSVICAGCILTTNISLGAQVQINLACTITHDVVMGDYTTLAPGVHVSGAVHLGRRVYIGTGAVIIQGSAGRPLLIEDDAVVGAGACVTRPVASGLTVVGVPAKPISRP